VRGPAAPTPAAAVKALLGGLQRELSCVSERVLVATGYQPEGGPHGLTPSGAEPVTLTGSSSLHLSLGLSYEIELAEEPGAEWACRVVSYGYVLEDARGGEAIVYHWHPMGHSSTTWPHLHVGPATGARAPWAGAHVPTGGPVSIGEVLRFCVLDLGVYPRRADWREVLGAPSEERPGEG